MHSQTQDILEQFGFTFSKSGAHTARTYMLEDLETLLQYVKGTQSSQGVYIHAIEDDNCLNKRTKKTRSITTRHLIELYSLNPEIALFRNLVYLWDRDPECHPHIALLCTFVRDALFRVTAPYILSFKSGDVVTRGIVEQFIEDKFPGRFSEATLKSVAQNINGTLTKSGHLQGKAKKTRSHIRPSPGSIAYGLLLGYLTGSRGPLLFSTEYIKMLDCSVESAIALALIASRKGWIVFKRIGVIIDVQFPNLLTKKEQGLIYGKD